MAGFHARHILFTGFNKTYYPLKPLKVRRYVCMLGYRVSPIPPTCPYGLTPPVPALPGNHQFLESCIFPYPAHQSFAPPTSLSCFIHLFLLPHPPVPFTPLVPLAPPTQESSSQSYGFVVEAEPFSQNVTMVTIRSPVQILNNMAKPCMVAMTMSSGLTSEAVAKAMVVNPGEKIPLSLSVAHEGHTFVKQQSKEYV